MFGFGHGLPVGWIELIGSWGRLLASKHRMGRHGVEREEGRKEGGKGLRTDVKRGQGEI